MDFELHDALNDSNHLCSAPGLLLFVSVIHFSHKPTITSITK